MPIELSFKIDRKQILKDLGGLEDQLEFAVASAANNIMFETRKAWPKIIAPQIDRPAPFTTRTSALLVKKATKRGPSANLALNKIQGDYLEALIEGRPRKPKDIELKHPEIPLALPVNVKLNKYGNVAAPTYKRIFDSATTKGTKIFLIGFDEATEELPAGIYERTKKARTGEPRKYTRDFPNLGKKKGQRIPKRKDKLKLLFAFVDRASYDREIQFFEPLLAEMNRVAPEAMRKAVEFALRTRR